MHWDIVEIGTCDFDYSRVEKGKTCLSVEAFEQYLNRLPNDRVKEPVAIVPEGSPDPVVFWKALESKLKQYNLPWWLKGCNSVKHPHKFYTHFPWDGNIKALGLDPTWPTINLIDFGVVVKEEVPALTWKQLCEKHNITSICFLKTDMEGLDIRIISEVLDHGVLPDIIRYEVLDGRNSRGDSDKLVSRLKSLGYSSKEDLVRFGNLQYEKI